MIFTALTVPSTNPHAGAEPALISLTPLAIPAAEEVNAFALSDRLPAVEHHLDIDFDGEDERFVTHYGTGQRGVSEYEVYSGLNSEILAPSALFDRPPGGDLSWSELSEPMPRIIDDLTLFDLEQQRITLHQSGGTCGSISSDYRFDSVEKRYKLTAISVFDVDDGRCFEYRYRYANGRKTLIDRTARD